MICSLFNTALRSPLLCEVSRLRSFMQKVSRLFFYSSLNTLSETGCIILQSPETLKSIVEKQLFRIVSVKKEKLNDVYKVRLPGDCPVSNRGNLYYTNQKNNNPVRQEIR